MEEKTTWTSQKNVFRYLTMNMDLHEGYRTMLSFKYTIKYILLHLQLTSINYTLEGQVVITSNFRNENIASKF